MGQTEIAAGPAAGAAAPARTRGAAAAHAPELATLVRLLGELMEPLDAESADAVADLQSSLEAPAPDAGGAVENALLPAPPREIAQAMIRRMLAEGSARAAVQDTETEFESAVLELQAARPTLASSTTSAESAADSATLVETKETPPDQEPANGTDAKSQDQDQPADVPALGSATPSLPAGPTAPIELPAPKETPARQGTDAPPSSRVPAAPNTRPNTPTPADPNTSAPRARERAPLAFGVRVSPMERAATPASEAAPEALPATSAFHRAGVPDPITPREAGLAVPGQSGERASGRSLQAGQDPSQVPAKQAAENESRQAASAEPGQDGEPAEQNAQRGRDEAPSRAAAGVAHARTPVDRPEPVTLPTQSSAPAVAPETAPPRSHRPGISETPRVDSAAALRTAEAVTPAVDAKSAAAHATPEIALRIAGPEASPVDVRVVQRAGQVHVDVRTPDAGLQTTLRHDLGTLVDSLERAGYHAEAFTPRDLAAQVPDAASAGIGAAGRSPVHQAAQTQGRGAEDDAGSGQRQQQFSQQQQQQQQQRRQAPAHWMEILEQAT